jgi:hypothetical protein
MSSHLVRVGFTPELLAEWLKHGTEAMTVHESIPEDALLVGTLVEDGIVWLVFEHPDFAEVSDGEEPSPLHPVFQLAPLKHRLIAWKNA